MSERESPNRPPPAPAAKRREASEGGEREGVNRYNVPGLERGMQILMLFDRTRRTITAPEITQSLGIPRTTVFRLLQTLQTLELVVPAEGGAHRLGPAVLRLGFEYIASLEITELARPVLERLRDTTGLAAQLVIRDGRDVVVIMRLPGPSAFQSSVSVGTRMPAHATVLGRVLLAGLSREALRDLYEGQELVQFSPHTPKSLRDLQRLLAEDLARGYSVSDSFYERGISAIAAPVRDGAGDIVAAVSVTMQGESVPSERRDALAREIVAAAGELSAQLNYRGAARTASAR